MISMSFYKRYTIITANKPAIKFFSQLLRRLAVHSQPTRVTISSFSSIHPGVTLARLAINVLSNCASDNFKQNAST